MTPAFNTTADNKTATTAFDFADRNFFFRLFSIDKNTKLEWKRKVRAKTLLGRRKSTFRTTKGR